MSSVNIYHSFTHVPLDARTSKHNYISTPRIIMINKLFTIHIGVLEGFGLEHDKTHAINVLSK